MMIYNPEMQLAEILARGEQLRERRERQIIRMTAVSSAALLLLLCFFIGSVAMRIPAGASQSQYGSFLLSPEAGGYVAAAVVAFALGVILTVMIYRHKHRMEADHRSSEERCRDYSVCSHGDSR